MQHNVTEIERIFQDVIERPVAERQRCLRLWCKGNETVFDEVKSLISSSENDDSFLDTPVCDDALALLTTSTRQSLIRKTIGSYRICSLLGRGGMGEVYLASDKRLERNVALKFLPVELAHDPRAKSRLIQEARAAAKLDHQNICQIYGLEEIDEHLFIVMQYIKGKRLSEYVRHRRLRNDQLFELIRQIICALAEAHTRGIIHRDIKPQNVMVTPTGLIKLLDFGLASRTSSKKLTQRQSAVNGVPGTVQYMSPEQLRGEVLDSRSDVFSLGTLMFEMVTGKNPFARKSPRESIAAIQNYTPNTLSSCSESRRPLGKIVGRCLAKDPKRRYQSANEILEDLERIVFLPRPSLRHSPGLQGISH